MSFWSPNIDSKGRIARACLGGILLVAAAVLFQSGSIYIGLLLAASGAFCLYEAARGWCVARACKIKTPL